ncbi:polysaccharide biosynthesis protein [Acholeplasma sp. OttesenSCG-928-E16]|nr:polysaccharide biosynthesis protein [Acholeplasma sp. OttesenSCG-928-E16]
MKTTKGNVGKKILRALSLILIDAISITITYVAMYALLNEVGIKFELKIILISLPIVVICKLLFNVFLGIYKGILKYTGFEDIVRIFVSSILSNFLLFLYQVISKVDFMVPIGYLFLTPLEIIFFMLPRAVPRLKRYVRYQFGRGKLFGKRTLIIGAGSGGNQIIKQLMSEKRLDCSPVAVLDDNVDKLGSRIAGIKIVGTLDDIEEICYFYHIEEVVVAIAEMPKEKLQKIVEFCNKKEINVRKMKIITNVDDKEVTKIDEIKIEDLLNRPHISLDNEGIEKIIKAKRVLVTGGGGSIGSELCRQIALLEPEQLVIFDIYENNAYDIQMELQRQFRRLNKKLNLEVIIGSVYNEARLETVFKRYRPNIVFHAAAYKHVPLMEDSPIEAVRTNVLGTYNCAKLADEYKTDKFILVSSDKAVRPTNVMGATKRFAEMVMEDAQSKATHTKYAAVRFGNVLGSNGSVVPLFKKQILEGGPVTVTHEEITRYFMTIPEAVNLILQCAVYAHEGEIFILDMGEPVKIIDLAKKMISLAGHTPFEDINIIVTGLRPGEKLYEELLVDESRHKKTDNDKIYIEECHMNKNISEIVSQFNLDFETMSKADVKKFVSKVVETYEIE